MKWIYEKNKKPMLCAETEEEEKILDEWVEYLRSTGKVHVEDIAKDQNTTEH